MQQLMYILIRCQVHVSPFLNSPGHWVVDSGAISHICVNSLFTKGSSSSFVALLLYVDDIVIVGQDQQVIDSSKSFLHG